MQVIHPPPAAPPTSTDTGLRALVADLDASEDPGQRDARRGAVVRRLVAAGLTSDLLEAVLPGWGRYCADPAPADRRPSSR